MNDQHIKACEMFGRVTTFGRNNAADFDPASRAAKEFAGVTAIMQEIDAGHADAKGSRTSVKNRRLAELRAEMKNLNRTAREVEKQVPGTLENFRMPPTSSEASALATARKMVTSLQAADLLAHFVSYEVSPEIVAQLTAMINGVEGAKDDTESDAVEGVENTAAIKLAIARGKELVDSLDATMNNKYKSNPAKLAAWQTASHIERAPRRKKAAAPAPATPAA